MGGTSHTLNIWSLLGRVCISGTIFKDDKTDEVN